MAFLKLQPQTHRTFVDYAEKPDSGNTANLNKPEEIDQLSKNCASSLLMATKSVKVQLA